LGQLHDDVECRQLRSVDSKRLPHRALDPISVHGTFQMPLADYQPQPGTTQLIANREDTKRTATQVDGRVGQDVIELPLVREAMLTKEAVRTSRFRHAERRFRPFALRALMTLRPLRVAIRALNPCVLLRLSTLG
jgi:hypothetical protein